MQHGPISLFPYYLSPLPKALAACVVVEVFDSAGVHCWGEKKVFFRTGNWMLVAEGRVEEER